MDRGAEAAVFSLAAIARSAWNLFRIVNMAICYWDAKMLCDARSRGVSFNNTITIGHLGLHLHPREVKFFRRSYRNILSPSCLLQPLKNYQFGDYSDGFLREFLGVSALTIMDFSTYEGADMIQDLNEPVPEHLENRFDALIDSGSLEHVFNFPVAVANLMKLVRVGGTIFITTPTNNLCGHGFYQFSPELMFRVFTKENGFELANVIVFEAAFPSIELTSHYKAYEVTDPEKVRQRVGLVSRRPIMMMIETRKIRETRLFAKFPLQSDYVDMWNEHQTAALHSGRRKILGKLWRNMPLFLRGRIEGYLQKRSFSLSNGQFYKAL